MKNLLSIILLSCFIAIQLLQAQNSNKQILDDQKYVVIEEMTGAWCQWCPRGQVVGRQLSHDYDNIIFVAIHTSDPMAYPEYATASGLTGAPSGNVNRIYLGDDTGQWEGHALAEMAVNPPAYIEVTTDYNETTGELEAIVSAEFIENLSGNYRLGGLVLEDGVTGPSPGYDQSNSYSGGGNGLMGGFENLPSPVPANMIAYDHVARELLGGYDGEEGSLPANINTGETHSYTFNYTVPEEFDPEYIRVAGWLIDQSNGHILNAGKSQYLPGFDNGKPHFISNPFESGFVSTQYIYQVFTSDPEDDNLTLATVDIPEWMDFELGNQNTVHTAGLLTGTPTDPGTYTVTLSVSDGEWTTEQTFDIVVEESLAGVWELMGSEGFTNGDSWNQDMAIADDGTIYLFTLDADILEVYKKEEGSDWESMGLNQSNGSQCAISIASDGTPYIVYNYDYTGVYVKKYTGESWEQVGGSPTNGYQIALALDSEDNPYIALQDANNGYEGWAYKYDGSNWVEVGGVPYSGAGISGVWNKMIIDEEDNVFVLWGDFSYSGTPAYVSKYDGNNWSVVGDGTISEHFIYYYHTFAMDEDGNIFVAFPEFNNQYLETVMYDGTSWSSIGSNLVSGAVEYCDMDITTEGEPIVTFLDITYSNTISAMVYDGSEWNFVGPRGFSGSSGSYPFIAILETTPYVAYADVALGEKATVRAYISAGAPLINIDPLEIVYDTTAVGQTSEYTVVVSNMGEMPLVVSSISTNNYIFSPDYSSFNIEPGNTQELVITFEPEDEQWYEGEITLLCNDPVNGTMIIEVSGYGDIATGIINQGADQFVLYPNPASDKVFINGIDGVERIQLISLSGQLLLEQTTTGKQIEVNTSEFESGIYFIKVFSHDNVITRKLVIE